MKKILNIFFVTLGVIFFILILLGTYFFITDPLNLKPLLFGDKSNITAQDTVQNVAQDQTKVESSNKISLSESQKESLTAFGINPADIPSEISAQQEACFESAVGSERVAEIKAGASPTAIDYFKAKDCI